MPRIKLQAQPRYEFSYEHRVRVTELNLAAHVGASEFTGIVHQARVELFRALGCREGDLGDGGTGMVIADIALNFRSEAFLGDELLVEAHIDEIEAGGFRIYNRISKNGGLVLLAETGIVAFRYMERSKGMVPGPFLDAWRHLQENYR